MDASYLHGQADWIEVVLALRADEINQLISRLQLLRDGDLGHFDLVRTDFAGETGISHIEVSLLPPGDSGGMQVG